MQCSFNSEAIRSTLRITKAIYDLQRVRILMLLQGGELCVSQVIEVPGLAPSTVSKRLTILNTAGLLDWRKKGRWVYFRLPEGKAGDFVWPVLKWLDNMLKDDEMIKADVRILKAVIACDPKCLCLKQRKRK